MKLVAVTVKVPSAAAMTGVDVSMFAAILVLPHGDLVLGLCTSERWGVPATPRTGAIKACECACNESAKTAEASVNVLQNMSNAKQGKRSDRSWLITRMNGSERKERRRNQSRLVKWEKQK